MTGFPWEHCKNRSSMTGFQWETVINDRLPMAKCLQWRVSYEIFSSMTGFLKKAVITDRFAKRISRQRKVFFGRQSNCHQWQIYYGKPSSMTVSYGKLSLMTMTDLVWETVISERFPMKNCHHWHVSFGKLSSMTGFLWEIAIIRSTTGFLWESVINDRVSLGNCHQWQVSYIKLSSNCHQWHVSYRKLSSMTIFL